MKTRRGRRTTGATDAAAADLAIRHRHFAARRPRRPLHRGSRALVDAVGWRVGRRGRAGGTRRRRTVTVIVQGRSGRRSAARRSRGVAAAAVRVVTVIGAVVGMNEVEDFGSELAGEAGQDGVTSAFLLLGQGMRRQQRSGGDVGLRGSHVVVVVGGNWADAGSDGGVFDRVASQQLESSAERRVPRGQAGGARRRRRFRRRRGRMTVGGVTL